MNGVIGNVWGMGKNLQVCFFIYLKVISKKKCQKYLLYTSLRAWPSELMTVFLKQFINVIAETHSQAAVRKVMASNILTFVGDLSPSMVVL